MNQSVLYLECNSGISGDMTVAALLDLGADRQVLLDALASLPLAGYSIEIKDVYKSGLRACDFNVILEHDNHDHDMEYLHGHAHWADNAMHGHIQNPAAVIPHEIHERKMHEHEIHEHEAHAHEIHEHEIHEHEIHEHEIHEHEIHEHEIHEHEIHEHGSHVHAEKSGASDSLPNHTHAHDTSSDPRTHKHETCCMEPAELKPVTPHPHAHTHEARNLRDITEIINAGRLSKRARELALHIFRILAQAEASVHGKSVDKVHFHEVGAVDSIVDIVAAAVCLDNLDPSRVVVSPLTDGTGQIRCQHGLIPVPVPAVTAIAAQNNLTLKLTDIEGELVTPTGAAIAAALQSGSLSADMQQPDTSCSGQGQTALPHFSQNLSAAGLSDEFRIRKIGLGAGKRDYATTGVLRAMLLEPQHQADKIEISPSPGIGITNDKPLSHQSRCDGHSDGSRLDSIPTVSRNQAGNSNRSSAKLLLDDDSADTILSLESNIDDCTGEALSFTMQELFAHGALDVFYVPIYMKKNRPAYLLRVLCRVEDRTVLESIIFKNTTTIGIRAQEMQRTKLPRQVVSIDTPWGKADVKCCMHNGETRCYPENDSVSELARRNQTGFPEMYHQIQEYARKALNN